MGYTLKMRIWRGDKSGGDLGNYDVEVSEGEVVLDALHRVQATQAGDLAIRWNCKAGKCGSCSAEINGMPRLLCMTQLAHIPRPAAPWASSRRSWVSSGCMSSSA